MRVLATMGFLALIVFQIETKRPQPKTKKQCRGYTVLDSSRIITCDNDTIQYTWRKNITHQ
jgi:hypothetical protein